MSAYKISELLFLQLSESFKCCVFASNVCQHDLKDTLFAERNLVPNSDVWFSQNSCDNELFSEGNFTTIQAAEVKRCGEGTGQFWFKTWRWWH